MIERILQQITSALTTRAVSIQYADVINCHQTRPVTIMGSGKEHLDRWSSIKINFPNGPLAPSLSVAPFGTRVSLRWSYKNCQRRRLPDHIVPECQTVRTVGVQRHLWTDDIRRTLIGVQKGPTCKESISTMCLWPI